MNQQQGTFIIRNTEQQIITRPQQASAQPNKCRCHTTPGEITIELDRTTAFEFTKDWDEQVAKKQFKIFFNSADLNANPDVLKVSNISQVRPPAEEMEEIYEIRLDDVGKIVKLVKVVNGIFHYNLESNGTEIASINNEIVENNLIEEDPNGFEMSGIYRLDLSNAQETTEIQTSSEETYMTSTQNRPPVIMKHDTNTQHQCIVEEIVFGTIGTNQSTQEPNVNEMEIDTCEEATPTKAFETKLKKKQAEVAPFHHNKRSPKRTPMTAQQLNEEFLKCRIQIGPNNTTVDGSVYHNINWTSVREATRKLLTATFPREVLASHSLTGKPSPAFRNLPIKKQLNPEIVEDIIHIVSKKCNVDARTIRSVITLKCADENKMWRLRKAKEKRLKEGKETTSNKENSH